MTIEQINHMNESDAHELFMNCCTAVKWVNAMVESRPFSNFEEMIKVSNQHFSNLEESDWLEAFDGHPKIGDVNSLKEKYKSTKKLASGEQSGMSEADEKVIYEMADLNQSYQEKNGFIFIVCATGKSASEMLEIIKSRIDNDRGTELKIASEEQMKITKIRLEKLS
ncbi:MAG: 2-oxo-4-hydroxy-4-carboxy-5-ureidoimidazoline decarboxylase [Deltaproteobacteria bacterium]|nr:MAG: 2-oxo-4-hydroxy-4-carboxy-5-ureidoimidazoline decarboxylase [Deltaproteobacteria bacterium]